ncbi:hypothetical protein NQ315_006228 [Exocentrus adspersus]|uniref:Uncharacterized protein n=1 Tax=Exocentrus adspersus TaxID=1586481 RepID=A0AAV8W104_9CUCU|nr:hypothetical protein NQ315_006228 [Exocentrus adspersus]
MGNAPSVLFGDGWWDKNDSTTIQSSTSTPHRDVSSEGLSEQHKERLSEFKLELARKHEKRRQILAEKRKEMEELREEVVRLKKENAELRQTSHPDEITRLRENEELRHAEVDRYRNQNEELKRILEQKSKLLEVSDDLVEKNRELRVSVAEMQAELQGLNKQVVDFEKERQDYQTHVTALKDVIAVSKHMLQIRESQLKELKEKVEGIERSLAGREMNILSQDLREEYERQLQNIRNLRSLYEERQRVHKREKEELVSQLDDAKKELAAEQTKNNELEDRIKALEEDNSLKYDQIKSLESNLGLSKAESRQYQAELTVINQLFSEILLGFNSSQDIDLDKLQKQLEDHRDLLQDIVVNEISPEVSYALPKVLLELLSQVNGDGILEQNEEGKLETIQEESESQTSTVHQMNSAEEIVENLPKVWKVLIELLSHQKAPTNELTDVSDDGNPCYKTVETPKGPSLVLSVSQTFIRLKDLILEKKSLEKETNHLKQLNGHLENRLQDQEKRLELVQSELSKTWLVVGKMQKQHQMLHTQEKILRYELAQKRKLLTELKEELEYSREKWTQAREKNSNTEQQWQQLRTEFASRRNTIPNDNSVESGYSDDRECTSSDEEPGYETDISECAQKGAEGEEADGVVKDVTVLDLVEDEVLEIVCVSSESGKEAEGSESTTEDGGEQPRPSLEQVLAQRDERLRRLEGQAEQLVAQTANTASRSVVIANRLDDLHEVYGRETTSNDAEAPPPVEE